MPADVSFHYVQAPPVADSSRRMPIGIGLTVAAFASVGLWVAVLAGVTAIFF